MISKNSSSVISGILRVSAFWRLLIPIFSPISTKDVFFEMLLAFLPP